VEVAEGKGGFGSAYGNYGASRFDEMSHFGSSYGTPGWQRAQRRGRSEGFEDQSQDYAAEETERMERRTRTAGTGGSYARSELRRRGPLTIEGELVAKSTGTVSTFAVGDRVFHIKFGNGNVTAVDGNKLTIQFDKAGEKRVVDSFVERV
jgi:DNA helicase-2/ATP-dependent DNA helicase PcrA